MPFYLMPTLGGHDSRLAARVPGVPIPGTARDSRAGGVSLRNLSGLDGALFYDAGKVADRRADLNFKDLEHDYGFGFGFNTNEGVVFRVDTGLGSRDGIVFGGIF